MDENVNLDEISIDSIKAILPYIFKVKAVQEENQKDEKLDKIVRGKIISVEEKIKHIENILKEKDEIEFNEMLETYKKDDIIATFLSLLELIKSRKIVVVQEHFFDDIIIKKNLEN